MCVNTVREAEQKEIHPFPV